MRYLYEIKKKSLKIILGLNTLLLSTISLAAPPPLFITFYKPNYNGEFVGVPAIITNTFLACTSGTNAVWSRITSRPLATTVTTPVSNGSPIYGYTGSLLLQLTFNQSNICLGTSAASINNATAAIGQVTDNTITYQQAFSFTINGFNEGNSFVYNNNQYTWRNCKQDTGDAASVTCCFDTDGSSCSSH